MRTVGLELGNNELRAVIGEPRRGRWQLLEAAVQPLPTDPAGRLAAVSAFIDQHARGAQVVVGLRLAESNVRLVSFPATTEENLARMARTEAESHFGVPADSLEFGWAVVDPATNGGEALTAVAVCRSDRLRQLLQPLTTAGITPHVVTLAVAGLANLFAATVRASGQATALLHLGDDAGELAILDSQGRLRQVRVVPPDTESAGAEVRRSLQAHAGATGEAVGQVLLVGNGVNGNAKTLTDLLGVPCVLADPWVVMGMATPMAEQSSAYAAATGLMLQGSDVALPLNLVRRAPTRAEQRRAQMTPATWGILAVLVALAVGVGWFFSAYNGRKATLEAAQTKVKDLEKQVDLAGGESTAFLGILQQTRDEVRVRSAWLELLRQLAERLPDGVSLDEWTCDRERGMTLRGQARNGAAITAVLATLNDMRWFEESRLDAYDANKIGNETVYNFQITCLLPAKERDTKAGAARTSTNGARKP